MPKASVEDIGRLYEFAREMTQLGVDVAGTAGRIASETFWMDGLAQDCVSRVRAGWEQALRELEAAESEYNYYASSNDEDSQVDLRALEEAVREAATAEQAAREDYNAIVALQAELKGYCSQLYSVLSSAGPTVSASLESVGEQITRDAFILEQYKEA